MCTGCLFFFFFFNDTATTEIYTLSLHDALPIFGGERAEGAGGPGGGASSADRHRSEEHTSELQSLTNLVCRLLLEKKTRSCCRTDRAAGRFGSNRRLTARFRGEWAVWSFRRLVCVFFFLIIGQPRKFSLFPY